MSGWRTFFGRKPEGEAPTKRQRSERGGTNPLFSNVNERPPYPKPNAPPYLRGSLPIPTLTHLLERCIIEGRPYHIEMEYGIVTITLKDTDNRFIFSAETGMLI